MTRKKTLKPARWEPWAFLLIVVLGAGLRLGYLRELRGTPEYSQPSIDAAYHHYWARGLATGRWYVTGGREDPQVNLHPYYRPPGYAFFLGGIYRVFGLAPLAPRLVQMLLGLLSALLAWRLGRRWFGFPAGLLAAAGLGLYWAFTYFEGELVGVSSTVLLLLFLLYGLDRVLDSPRRWLWVLASGVAGGILLLFRPNALLSLLLVAAWLVWAARPRGRAPAAVFLAVVIGSLLAVTWRNWRVAGEFVPLATNAGISIGVANNDQSDGTTHTIPGIGDVGTPFDWPAVIRRMERTRNLPPGSLSHGQASSLLVEQARDWITSHPGRFLYLLGRKALLFWGPAEVRNIREVYFARRFSPVLSRIPLSFPVPAALGLLGTAWLLLRTRRRRREKPLSWQGGVLVLLVFWSYFLSLLPFAAAARYRVPLVPLMFLLGGAYLAGMLARDRPRGPAFVFWLAAAPVLFLLGNLHPVAYRPSPEKWHYDRGLAWTDAGELNPAAEEFQAALNHCPDFYRAANNLGNIEMFRRRFREAEELYRQVLAREPNLARTRSNLGNAIYNQAVNPPLPPPERAQEMIREAIGHYRAALQLRPDLVEAHNNLGVALIRLGRPEEGIKEYLEALRYRPGNISTLLNLGEALAARGDVSGARDCYLRILSLSPGHPEAARRLAALPGS